MSNSTAVTSVTYTSSNPRCFKFIIDGTAPSISVTRSAQGYQQTHTANMTFSDSGSGLRYYYYCWF